MLSAPEEASCSELVGFHRIESTVSACRFRPVSAETGRRRQVGRMTDASAQARLCAP